MSHSTRPPLPADPQPTHRERPHSIVQALELEHALDNESLPPDSPLHDRPASLDPHIIASIVTQLRMSLAEVTRERDALARLVSEANTREVELKESLQLTTDKCTHLQSELEEVKLKMKEDEESITMLRGKVEESRRGVMRLQNENRRMSGISNMTIDLSRAAAPSFGTPSSAKRASFTPLMTGSGTNGHRRISSVSDSGLLLRDLQLTEHSLGSVSPNPQILTFAESENATPSAQSRRFSGFFGQPSPPKLPQSSRDSLEADIELLRVELKAIKVELEESRSELTESNEAREASETCVRALRDFIAQNGVGIRGDESSGATPLPPSSTQGDEAAAKRSAPVAGGWGFKLWKVDAATDTQPGPASPASTTSRISHVSTPPTVTQFSKKFGGFFASRGSISSTSPPPAHPMPPLQALESMSNESDISSVDDSAVEPISPVSELPQSAVMVRHAPSSMGGSMDGLQHVVGMGVEDTRKNLSP
ncbi:hypothetical protein JAAARDRAFT_123069 [Jaapia argillacea MUCL 33604]|uniref:Uncharacterized protein n=1 Tax=Jaapia argillacea MUCL 33604 TaxID=933084 RepID=A0A067QG81_9AGAM|nr:hypothetical protein JAAARDRAFT_123069 [Jaapia argillacea MUCL 33604]